MDRHFYWWNYNSSRVASNISLTYCLNWKIYCDDHSSLSSTTAVQTLTIGKKKPEKKSGLQRDSNPWPTRSRCDALPTELWSDTLGVRLIYWVHIFPCSENDVKFTYIYCDDHSSLSSTTGVPIWIISYKLHISLTHLIIHQVKKRKSTVEEKTYQTFETVSSAIQTPRILSKTLRCLPLVFQTLYLASRGSFLASLLTGAMLPNPTETLVTQASVNSFTSRISRSRLVARDAGDFALAKTPTGKKPLLAGTNSQNTVEIYAMCNVFLMNFETFDQCGLSQKP